jgi:hypothetical protein
MARRVDFADDISSAYQMAPRARRRGAERHVEPSEDG